MERRIGPNTLNNELVECLTHLSKCSRSGITMGNQFTDQTVVMRRHGITVIDVRIDANPGASRRVKGINRARGWQKVAGVLCINPALEGMTVKLDVLLLEGELFTRGNQQLLAHNVDTGDHLGHWMLHLNTGVHFNKVEASIFIEKFEGTRAAITHINTGFNTGFTNFPTQFVINAGGRRFLYHLLMPTLQRAIAIPQVHRIALAICQYLYLHMARPLEELLYVHHRRTEGSLRFRLSDLDRAEEHLLVVNDAHTPATAASGCLDDHGEANVSGYLKNFIRVIRYRTLGTRNRWHA